MAKETCKHCGSEIGFVSQVKLIDGAFICKDCYKKAGNIFHNMASGYAAYEQLLKEQERNNIIFEKILKGQKKSELFGATSAWYLYCYAGCGLMYFKTERGGFVGLGADKIYNIYRYADLASYELIEGSSTVDHRMEDGKEYILLTFNGDYAVREVYMPGNRDIYKKLSKYFDECFGLSTGKIGGGFMSGLRRANQDAMVAASVANGIKSFMNGGDKEKAMDDITSGTQMLLQGDRSKWIEKADQALAGAGIAWNV